MSYGEGSIDSRVVAASVVATCVLAIVCVAAAGPTLVGSGAPTEATVTGPERLAEPSSGSVEEFGTTGPVPRRGDPTGQLEIREGWLDPVARCELSETTVEPGEPVTVDASGSSDADDFQYARDADAGFGDFTDSSQWQFEYGEPGEYTPRVRVWSYPNETTDTATCGTVEVRDSSVSVELSASPNEANLTTDVRFDVSQSGDPRGELEFRWDWTGDGEVDQVTTDADGIAHRYRTTGRYEATVTVVDEAGNSDTGTADVSVGPVARCSVVPGEVEPGESVEADAGDSPGADDYEFARSSDAAFAFAEGSAVTFTYDEPGTYTPAVRVWAYPSETSETTTCGTVRVAEPDLSVSLTAEPSTTRPGEPVVFDAAVSGSYDGSLEFRWDWTSDGEVDEVTRDPDGVTHDYSEPGSYVATVTVVDESGTTATAETTVQVETEVVARCTVSPSRIEPGDSVEVDASESSGATIYRFAKDGDRRFGDERDDPVAEITYPEAGTYSPRVRVAGPDGERTDVETCGTVTVEDRSFEVRLDYDPAAPFVGDPVVFNATVTGDPRRPLQFFWDWNNDGVVNRTTESSGPISHRYDRPGEYEVKVTVEDESGDRASTVRVVGVEGEDTTTSTTSTTTTTTTTSTTTSTTVPEGERSAPWWYSPLEPLSGENVTLVAEDRRRENLTYEWDLDDDGSYELTGVTAVHAFGAAGNRTVALRVTWPDGGTETARRSIEVHEGSGSDQSGTDDGPSIWTIPYDPVVDEPVTLIVDPTVPAGAVSSVNWDLDGDGDPDAEGLVATTTFDGSGSVSVRVDREDGSSEEAQRTVSAAPRNRTPTTEPPPAAADPERNETTRGGPTTGETEEDRGGDEIDGEDVVDRVRRTLPVPGFGAPTAAVAVVLAVFLARRRRSR